MLHEASLVVLGDALRTAPTTADAIAAAALCLGETLRASRAGYALIDTRGGFFPWRSYLVVADAQIIGRIALLTSSPAGTPWMWSIFFAFQAERHPTHGFEPTRDAAMQAFARCWHRE